MAYFIPQQKHLTRHEIKKSSFIGIAQYAASRDDALSILNDVKQAYSDARHHCWAYLLGPPAMPTGIAMADDGEPSGTAGKPILNVLQHNQIGDVMLVVVRYFGGIKLGAGGLVRAYSASAQLTLESLPVVEQVIMEYLQVHSDFKHEQYLRHFIERYTGQLVSISYSTQVTLTLALPPIAINPLYALAGSMGFTVNKINRPQ